MPAPVKKPANGRVTSKVDDRLKAAEARRNEREREREERLRAEAEARRNRVKQAPLNEGGRSRSELNVSLMSGHGANNVEVPQSVAPQNVAPQNTVPQSAIVHSVAGRWIRFPDGTMTRVPCDPWRSKTQKRRRLNRRKLFTLEALERLIAQKDDSGDLERIELGLVVVDVLRRSCSARHRIQNKLNILAGNLVHRQRSLHRHREQELEFDLEGSPQLASLRLQSRSCSLSLESVLVHRDGEGLLSMGVIDEITARHNLSPNKRNSGKDNETGRNGSLAELAESMGKGKEKEKGIPSQDPITPANASMSMSRTANFLTVLSPRKHVPRGSDLDTDARVLTPQRKSSRLFETRAGESSYDPDKVAAMLMEDADLVFVANPYIPGTAETSTDSTVKSPTKRRSPRKPMPQ